MSNHAKRRVRTLSRLFPSRTLPTPMEAAFLALKAKMDHRIDFVEIGARVIELRCTCGWVDAAPFGEEQAEKMRERHYALFHVIPDPLAGKQGAKYRA